MKRLLNTFAIIGIIAMVALVATVIRYGTVNMSRAEADLYRWHVEHRGP